MFYKALSLFITKALTVVRRNVGRIVQQHMRGVM